MSTVCLLQANTPTTLLSKADRAILPALSETSTWVNVETRPMARNTISSPSA